MWAAIVKGTTSASAFIARFDNKKRGNDRVHLCPWTKEVITQEEYEENQGNPNHPPKWRLRKNPKQALSPPLRSLGEEHAKIVKYSDELLIERIRAWGKKNKFQHPQIQTVIENMDRGFRPAFSCERSGTTYQERLLLSACNHWLICSKMEQKRPHLAPEKDDICFPVPYNTPGGDSSIDLANLYLWPLLHSRADEVVACRTFGDWTRLFNATIHLAFPSYHEWIRSKNSKSLILPSCEKMIYRLLEENINPSRALYLISVKSNFWPYGRESVIPKWSQSPLELEFKSKDLREREVELDEMKRKYPKNAVYSVHTKKKTTAAGTETETETETEAETGDVAVEGGRNATGLCAVKKLKERGDSAEIQWFVSADFLRKMKRVHLYLETYPWPGVREVMPHYHHTQYSFCDSDDDYDE
jgi:hypothetical protein